MLRCLVFSSFGVSCVTRAVPTVVHLLQRLLSHGFDLLLVVEAVCDLQCDLLLLHGGEFVAVRLLVSRGAAVNNHFIERF